MAESPYRAGQISLALLDYIYHIILRLNVNEGSQMPSGLL